MTTDDFIAKVARVRERFASTLPGKIADSFAALEKMANDGDDAIETVITTHRRLHEMCGIAPTLGFEATGKAARSDRNSNPRGGQGQTRHHAAGDRRAQDRA